jgi:hypothetical protein
VKRLRRAWWAVAAGVALLAGGAVWAAPSTWQGYPVVRVVLDGQDIQSDVPAVILGGRTLLPVRALAEALGLQVSWDPDTRTASLSSKGRPTPAAGKPLIQMADQGVVLAITGVTRPSQEGGTPGTPSPVVSLAMTLTNPTGQSYPLQGWTPTVGVVKGSQDQSGARPIVMQCASGVAVPNLTWCQFLDPTLFSPLAKGVVKTGTGGALPDALAPGASVDIEVDFQLPSLPSSGQVALNLGNFGALIVPPLGCNPLHFTGSMNPC